jgi:hypothetical protein
MHLNRNAYGENNQFRSNYFRLAQIQFCRKVTSIDAAARYFKCMLTCTLSNNGFWASEKPAGVFHRAKYATPKVLQGHEKDV